MKPNYKQTKQPLRDNPGIQTELTDATIQERKTKVLNLMKQNQLSSLIIYADKEHGANFEYLVGFIPRFEEAIQILNVDGSSILILGNENHNKAKYARIPSESFKCSMFSLPNQPMASGDELKNIISEAAIDTSQKVGLVGWKLIPGIDIPNFIVEAIKTRTTNLVDATGLMIDPAYGARTTNNANEIAHYEYGASLASDGVLNALNNLEVGKSELEIGAHLHQHGQYNTVVSIAAFGERFVNANIYPTHKKLEQGDKVALTTAYKGGLSSRAGYAVETREELEQVDPGYLENVVYPYFTAYNYWLQNVKPGVHAGEFYANFEAQYPQRTYGWELCPGHLVADEEWLSSPFFKGSNATVASGMLFQVDFIPSQKQYKQGVSAESTVAIADTELQNEIKASYPELWTRIQNRRAYLKQELNIDLPDEILPLASTLGYIRPFMLNKDISLYLEN
ncbi:M24 family metallopeptidase [Jeotgalibaca sp. A122]|uniref:M24 family metallopeptidase n=1 Tax=Jeotgalibaca sp. A122 TaxID=3457322 RepID=UPI003FD23F22